MKHLRKAIRRLILSESNQHISKLATLLTGTPDFVNQGIELGETLGLIRNAAVSEADFMSGMVHIEMETDPDLCTAIQALRPASFDMDSEDDGWFWVQYIVFE